MKTEELEKRSSTDKVTSIKRQQRLLDPDYIKLCTNDIATYKWYFKDEEKEDKRMMNRVSEDGKKLVKSREAAFGRGRITGDDVVGLLYEPPTKYTVSNGCGRTFEDFVEKARVGRHWERVITYHLMKAGVICELLPAVYDGNTDKKEADILVRSCLKNSNGSFQWFRIELKTHNSTYKKCVGEVDVNGQNGYRWRMGESQYTDSFTDERDTWLDTLMVDNVRSWDKKVENANTAEGDKMPLLGVLKIDTSSEAIIFIPTASSPKWTVRRQDNKKQTTMVFDAPKECFLSFNEFVDLLDGEESIDEEEESDLYEYSL